MLVKNIFIVYSDYDLFTKTIQRKNKKSEIINPHSIRKRFSTEGDDCPPEVVAFNIVKRINSFKLCKTSSFIYYYANILDSELLNSLTSLFGHCSYLTYFHLLIEDTRLHLIDENIKSKFQSIQVISNEKR